VDEKLLVAANNSMRAGHTILLADLDMVLPFLDSSRFMLSTADRTASQVTFPSDYIRYAPFDPFWK